MDLSNHSEAVKYMNIINYNNYCKVLLDMVTVLLDYIVCSHSWCTIIV